MSLGRRLGALRPRHARVADLKPATPTGGGRPRRSSSLVLCSSTTAPSLCRRPPPWASRSTRCAGCAARGAPHVRGSATATTRATWRPSSPAPQAVRVREGTRRGGTLPRPHIPAGNCALSTCAGPRWGADRGTSPDSTERRLSSGTVVASFGPSPACRGQSIRRRSSGASTSAVSRSAGKPARRMPA